MAVRAVGIKACLERVGRCINSKKVCDRLKLTASAVSAATAPLIPVPFVAGGVCVASAHYLVHKLCSLGRVYEPFDLPPRKWKHIASGAAVAGIGAVAAICIPSSLGWGLAIGAGGVILGHAITYYDYYFLLPVEQVFDDDQLRLEDEAPLSIPEGASAR